MPGSRMVLGFDSSCCSCSRIATAVREAAGGRLEVMGLDDPPMRDWRSDSTQPRPTLVVVTGDRVRVHSGWRLPFVLAAELGPARAMRVLTALVAAGRWEHRNGSRTAPHESGALSRRTVLGGLTAAVGLIAGTATVGRYSTAAAPIAARPVEPGSSELARVQANPAVTAAGDRFGTADWSRVVAAHDPGDGSVVYFVPYSSPGNGTAHLSTTASQRDPALLIRQVSNGNGTGQIDFYDVRGAPVGALPVGASSEQPRPDRTVLPPDIYRQSAGGIRLTSATSGDVPGQLDRAFFRCFANCLQANGAQDAIEPCFSCVTGSYLYCLECTIRSGFQARKCYGECGGRMYAGA